MTKNFRTRQHFICIILTFFQFDEYMNFQLVKPQIYSVTKTKSICAAMTLTTIPFKPNKTAPLYLRGSILVLNLFNAGFERMYPHL